MSLKTSTNVRHDVAVIKLDGDITLGEASGQLRDIVRQALKDGYKSILLDLGGVAYIDSAGLGELVSCHAAANDQAAELKLVHLQKKVQGLMQITKLTTVFESFEDEAAAVQSFQRSNPAPPA